jgi:hypothetical protein
MSDLALAEARPSRDGCASGTSAWTRLLRSLHVVGRRVGGGRRTVLPTSDRKVGYRRELSAAICQTPLALDWGLGALGGRPVAPLLRRFGHRRIGLDPLGNAQDLRGRWGRLCRRGRRSLVLTRAAQLVLFLRVIKPLVWSRGAGAVSGATTGAVSADDGASEGNQWANRRRHRQ